MLDTVVVDYENLEYDENVDVVFLMLMNWYGYLTD
jgi:hypothetical protein